MTAPKLTDEMRQALAIHPSGPIAIEDEQTHSFYVLLTKDDYCRLQNDHYRRELQIAFDQVGRGEVTDLDMNALLVEANRRPALHK